MRKELEYNFQNDFTLQLPESFILLVNDKVDRAKKKLAQMGFVPTGENGLKWMTEDNFKMLPHIVIHNNQIFERNVLLDHGQLKQWGLEPKKLLPIIKFTDLLQKHEQYQHSIIQRDRYLSDLCQFERTMPKCWEAIKKDGWNLALVPEEIKTPQMCRLALASCVDNDFLHNNSHILMYVPFSEVCLEELKKMPQDLPINILKAASYIRPQVINDSIADYLVSSVKGQSLSVLPVHLQTKERVQEAVRVSGSFAILRNVRQDMLTTEVYQNAAKHSWQSFRYIPSDRLTPEICMEAALRYPNDFTPNIVPKGVSNGCNIYTLYKTLVNITKSDNFSIDQLKDLYNGKPMQINGIHSDNGVIKNGILTFDADKKQLLLKPVKLDQSKKEQQDTPISKPLKPKTGQKI